MWNDQIILTFFMEQEGFDPLLEFYWNYIYSLQLQITVTKSHEIKKVTKKIKRITHSSAAINQSLGEILLWLVE
jgi:hypothetical protein